MTELETRQALARLNLQNTPAYDIVTRPGHELWKAVGNANVAKAVCENTYWYGRNGNLKWSWISSSTGFPNVEGEPLARGTITTANCGGFNMTARWIGKKVMGLGDEFKGSFTDANEFFITRKGTTVIDRDWPGNVRTLSMDFATTAACLFMGHSFCSYTGSMLDASTNVMNFAHKTDLYWCALRKVYDPKVREDGRAFYVKLGGRLHR